MLSNGKLYHDPLGSCRNVMYHNHTWRTVIVLHHISYISETHFDLRCESVTYNYDYRIAGNFWKTLISKLLKISSYFEIKLFEKWHFLSMVLLFRKPTRPPLPNYQTHQGHCLNRFPAVLSQLLTLLWWRR